MQLFQDQTEVEEGNCSQQREGRPAATVDATTPRWQAALQQRDNHGTAAEWWPEPSHCGRAVARAVVAQRRRWTRVPVDVATGLSAQFASCSGRPNGSSVYRIRGMDEGPPDP